MAITKVTPNMIQVANNVTSNTIGSANQRPQLVFDENGVIISAANVAIDIPAGYFTANAIPTMLMLSGM